MTVYSALNGGHGGCWEEGKNDHTWKQEIAEILDGEHGNVVVRCGRGLGEERRMKADVALERSDG